MNYEQRVNSTKYKMCSLNAVACIFKPAVGVVNSYSILYARTEDSLESNERDRWTRPCGRVIGRPDHAVAATQRLGHHTVSPHIKQRRWHEAATLGLVLPSAPIAFPHANA